VGRGLAAPPQEPTPPSTFGLDFRLFSLDFRSFRLASPMKNPGTPLYTGPYKEMNDDRICRLFDYLKIPRKQPLCQRSCNEMVGLNLSVSNENAVLQMTALWGVWIRPRSSECFNLYRATLSKRGTSSRLVSVRLSVCHTHALHPNGYRYHQTFFSAR